MSLGTYAMGCNGRAIREEIENENSPYYYDWRGILSDPYNRHLSIYDYKDIKTGESYYYFSITAYKYIDNNQRVATLSPNQRHSSVNECLVDLIENYPFVRL